METYRHLLIPMTQALVNDVKERYPSYEYYLVGSVVRNNHRPNDIDIGIIPPKGRVNLKEWEQVLKLFEDKYIEDLKVDAQIVPAYRRLFNLKGDTVRKIANTKIFRYVYHTGIPDKREYARYSRACGNLWRKQVMIVSPKYRERGLMGMEFTNKKL